MAGNISNSENQNLKFYLEVKPHLTVAQGSICAKSSSGEEMATVDITSEGIVVHSKEGKVTCQVDLLGLSLDPSSCHGLNWEPGNSGFTFRMKTRGQGGELLQLPNASEQCYQSELESYKRSDFSACCKWCGQYFIQKIKFVRVLDLPKEGWQEMTDSWFCHPHHHHDSHSEEQTHTCDTSTTAILNIRDCFVGSVYFLVHKGITSQTAIDFSPSGSLSCQRCKAVIGSQFAEDKSGVKSGEILKIFHHAVVLTDPQYCKPQSDDFAKVEKHKMETWLLGYLLQESRQHNSPRILVESRKNNNKPTPYCLFWLLDSPLLMYQCSMPIDQFGNSEELYHAKLNPEVIVKIMYKSCLSKKNQKLGEQWRHEFAVHVVELPDDLCRQLSQLLIENTQLMPKSLQHTNDFHLTFLRKE